MARTHPNRSKVAARAAKASYTPTRISVEDLIAALECGEMGEVEFTELALEAGMPMEQIGAELAKAREGL